MAWLRNPTRVQRLNARTMRLLKSRMVSECGRQCAGASSRRAGVISPVRLAAPLAELLLCAGLCSTGCTQSIVWKRTLCNQAIRSTGWRASVKHQRPSADRCSEQQCRRPVGPVGREQCGAASAHGRAPSMQMHIHMIDQARVQENQPRPARNRAVRGKRGRAAKAATAAGCARGSIKP